MKIGARFDPTLRAERCQVCDTIVLCSSLITVTPDTKPHISLRVNWMNFLTLKPFHTSKNKGSKTLHLIFLDLFGLRDVLNDSKSGQGISILSNPQQSRGGGSIISGLALTMIGCFANTQRHLVSVSPL